MNILNNTDPKTWTLKGGAIRAEPIIFLIILTILVIWFGLYVYINFFKDSNFFKKTEVLKGEKE